MLLSSTVTPSLSWRQGTQVTNITIAVETVVEAAMSRVVDIYEDVVDTVVRWYDAIATTISWTKKDDSSDSWSESDDSSSTWNERD